MTDEFCACVSMYEKPTATFCLSDDHCGCERGGGDGWLTQETTAPIFEYIYLSCWEGFACLFGDKKKVGCSCSVFGADSRGCCLFGF